MSLLSCSMTGFCISLIVFVKPIQLERNFNFTPFLAKCCIMTARHTISTFLALPANRLSSSRLPASILIHCTQCHRRCITHYCYAAHQRYEHHHSCVDITDSCTLCLQRCRFQDWMRWSTTPALLRFACSLLWTLQTWDL
jgi:hypothetical protein